MKKNKSNLLFLFLFFTNLIDGQVLTTSIDTVRTDSLLCITYTYTMLDDQKIINQASHTKCFYLNSILSEEYSDILTRFYCKGINLGLLINGQFRSYYSNGNVKEISNYILGHKSGLSIVYYENSNVKEIGQYTNISDICEFETKYDSIVQEDYPIINTKIIPTIITKKVGEWIYYLPNGEIERKEEY